MTYTGYPEFSRKSLREIVGLFPRACYQVDCNWKYLEKMIADQKKELGLDIDPVFQRAHVWTEKQQIDYVEYSMLGGELAKSLTFAAVGWRSISNLSWYALVDGKQRLEAVRKYLRNELPVFGRLYADHDDVGFSLPCSFGWRVVEVDSPRDCAKIYLALNRGGTPHTAEDIAKAEQALLLLEGR